MGRNRERNRKRNREKGIYYHRLKLSIKYVQKLARRFNLPKVYHQPACALFDDINWRLRHILDEALLFMRHAKRTKLLPGDVISAIKLVNKFPDFEFESMDEKELPIDWKIACSDNNNVSIETSILEPVIDIPDENFDTSNDNVQTDNEDDSDAENITSFEMGEPVYQNFEVKASETVQIKKYAVHALHPEQQRYYINLTEGCVGPDEARRIDALRSLTMDQNMCLYMPALISFIGDGLDYNIVHSNLTINIYLMRMLTSLLENPSIHINKYLHKIIPIVITSIVTIGLSNFPQIENHWSLRDYSSRLLYKICERYSNAINNIQMRVITVFMKRIMQSDTVHLFALYGSLKAISEFGFDAIKKFIVPNVKSIGRRLENVLEKLTSCEDDIIAAAHLKEFLLTVITPVIAKIRSPPDVFDNYVTDYGYIGNSLINSVVAIRIGLNKCEGKYYEFWR